MQVPMGALMDVERSAIVQMTSDVSSTMALVCLQSGEKSRAISRMKADQDDMTRCELPLDTFTYEGRG